MYDVWGLPFDLGGPRLGSRFGPDSVRMAGLHSGLNALGVPYRECGNVVAPVNLPFEHADSLGWDEGGSRDTLFGFDAAVATHGPIREALRTTYAAGHRPLLIGGDHGLSMATVSTALEATRGDMAVLWIDAHADMNNPATSPSGRLHGMPLGALVKRPAGVEGPLATQWNQLLTETIGGVQVKPENIAWIGLRDVDAGERDWIREHELGVDKPCYAASMYWIDRQGLTHVVESFFEWLSRRRVSNLWISFDVDVMDPVLAPGTGTTVRGGMTYREAHLLAELLSERLNLFDRPRDTGKVKLAGIEVVEVNPLLDTNNTTASMTVEWLSSLFGKRILVRAEGHR